jgi:hypothetical protein
VKFRTSRSLQRTGWLARSVKAEMDKLEDALRLYRELQRAHSELVEAAVRGADLDAAMAKAESVRAIAAG